MAAFDYRASEEYPDPGQNRTLVGIVLRMGAGQSALEASFDTGAIPLVDFDIQDDDR